MAGVPRDAWSYLAGRTPARIGLGRAGTSLPTRELLKFATAHAQARDAVYAELDFAALKQGLAGIGHSAVQVASQAVERAHYLARPDLGRRLDKESMAKLEGLETLADLVVVIGDGLSAAAVNAHALPLISAFLPLLSELKLSLGPIVLARGARVALGDEIAASVKAKTAAVLIGERPGLSSPDSLGVYLTFDARPGRVDAERNCLSNIRLQGLPPEQAARRLAWLVGAAFERGLTGIALKDESDVSGICLPDEQQMIGQSEKGRKTQPATET